MAVRRLNATPPTAIPHTYLVSLPNSTAALRTSETVLTVTAAGKLLTSCSRFLWFFFHRLNSHFQAETLSRLTVFCSSSWWRVPVDLRLLALLLCGAWLLLHFC